MINRYYKFSQYLKQRFNEPVRKLSLDLGLGCPNRDGFLSTGGCIYCDESGSGTGKKDISIEEQIETGLKRLSSTGTEKVIGYFQSFTNTYCSPEFLEEKLNILLNYPEIAMIYIGTRPDMITADHLRVLENINKKKEIGIEFGLQSSNDRTLETINRRHSVKDFENAVNITKQFKFFITAHVIIGLPGETQEDNINTARFLSGLKIDSVKIHQLYVVRETRLELLYLTGEYIPLKFEEAVENTIAFLRHLRRDIIIQRLTGDPKPGQASAPNWIHDKARFLKSVEDNLEGLNSFQGDLL
ncbi:MAG TPA: TIGR01212 family radical SAM protein [Firmicutes bacterium]|nr:TIGR01212 family radical SAM protein [Bacillota bacterium]